MYIVRDIFTAKPGMASKLAQHFRTVSKQMMPGANGRVLTDLVGDYNTIVLESEASDLSEFEKRSREYREKPEFQKAMTGYTEMWVTGKREILRVVD